MKRAIAKMMDNNNYAGIGTSSSKISDNEMRPVQQIVCRET